VSEVPERRKFGIRRDINGLVRGKDGEISGSKIGTYLAQFIAAKLLLENGSPLPGWDEMSVLFLVLIAPEAYKQVLAMKFGGNPDQITTVTDTHEKTTKEVVSQPAEKAKDDHDRAT